MLHPAALLVLSLGLGAAVPAQDALDQLDASFHQAYLLARGEARSRSGPVLLVAGDHLQFWRDGTQVAGATIRPPLYHRLKAVDHVPLGVSLLLGEPGRARAEDLRRCRDRIRAARADLGAWCPPDLRPRQEQILDACGELLDQRLDRGRLEPGHLARCAARLGPPLLANAAAAAVLELERLDLEVGRIRTGLGAGEWPSLRVVVLGSHMARDREVALQYFTRLLGEPGEGGRVVFAEGADGPGAALDLLAVHRLDGALGAAFFGDPGRMHRDVLADGARRWLDRHLPAAGGTR
jgi:hypothetical protein